MFTCTIHVSACINIVPIDCLPSSVAPNDDDLEQISDEPHVLSNVCRPDCSMLAAVTSLAAAASAASAAFGVPCCSPAAAAARWVLLDIELLGAVLPPDPAAVWLGNACVIIPAELLTQRNTGGCLGGVAVM
jgi:hypothetical protein